jgi:hypothetical protein
MFKKILKWLGARLKERSTYADVATIAAVAGAPALGVQIDQVGQAVALIVGSGLVAATTRPSAEDAIRAIIDH